MQVSLRTLCFNKKFPGKYSIDSNIPLKLNVDTFLHLPTAPSFLSSCNSRPQSSLPELQAHQPSLGGRNAKLSWTENFLHVSLLSEMHLSILHELSISKNPVSVEMTFSQRRLTSPPHQCCPVPCTVLSQCPVSVPHCTRLIALLRLITCLP